MLLGSYLHPSQAQGGISLWNICTLIKFISIIFLLSVEHPTPNIQILLVSIWQKYLLRVSSSWMIFIQTNIIILAQMHYATKIGHLCICEGIRRQPVRAIKHSHQRVKWCLNQTKHCYVDQHTIYITTLKANLWKYIYFSISIDFNNLPFMKMGP